MMRIHDVMRRAAGVHRDRWDRTVRFSLAASVVQAGAYLLLIPLVLAITRGDGERTSWLLVALVGTLLVEGVLRLQELSFENRWSPKVVEDIRLRLGEQLRRIPAEELARRRSGDLTTVVGSNASNAVMAVSEIGTLFLRVVVVPTALLVAMAVIDWRLAVALVVAGLVAVPGIRQVRAQSARGFREMSRDDAETASRVVEYVQGLPVMRATGQVGDRSERLMAALRRQGETLDRLQRDLTRPGLLASAGVNLGVVALTAAGTALVLGARLDAATLAALVVAAVRFAEPVATATLMTALFELADDGLQRIDEVLAVPPLPAAERPVPVERHDVVLDRVSFAYAGQNSFALEAVSLTVPERSLTALVGPSGGGKTTVTRLITRYADPQDGAVRIGGVDLREVEPGELARQFATVFQDVYLFDATVGENVRMARPDADDIAVLAALEEAGCGELLRRLPRGLDTPVGEIGAALSGGERQRISIARALLKDAPILLLDEPTAALDAESEVAVQAAIDRLVTDRTVLVIAHRLSTVVGADQILVLEAGRIVERGRHDELVAAGGRYAAMWAAQTAARRWRVPA